MDRIENPELRQKMLDHLASKYKINEVREPNHLSSYVYCLTKTYLEQKQASEPTEEEVMLFSLGYGLQDILTPWDAETPVIEKEGIIYRPDMLFDRYGLCELKTTRKSARNHLYSDALADTWLDYMRGGCYMMDTQQYNLIVLYMMGTYAPPFPRVYADQITFTVDEIQSNWDRIVTRKMILDVALESGKPPQPFKYNYDWECRYCRHNLLCNSMANIIQ
jgi:hypothetical protein